MYYIITERYVGPNPEQYLGDSDVLFIHTEPGRTNGSHEVKIRGWLGTTNDWSSNARGEYETLEQAKKSAAEMGYDVEQELDEYEMMDDESSVVAVFKAEEDTLEQWGALEWLDAVLYGPDDKNVVEIHGYGHISARMGDKRLKKMAARINADAYKDGVKVHDTTEFLIELRDGLRG
jgi:hypothetical protein